MLNKSPSLKLNVIANYLSQIYVTGVGILILPLYIKYMGAEAYGLVGFFAMLQAWFSLLDMGLTPTISRETARYNGGSTSALAYRQLLRALTLIFCCIALLGGSVLWFLAGVIAKNWLIVESLSLHEVKFSLQVMAISIALRWMSGIYRGIVSGSEKLVWLSGFNVLIATMRFILIFMSMWIYGFTPTVFFIHQLFVSVIELVCLFLMGNRLTPDKKSIKYNIGWSFQPVKQVLKFSLTIAFTSSVWVLATQVDKLILSGILPLDEYGFFTLAVLVASGILILSGPISLSIMPRMSRLYAEGSIEKMLDIYRQSTQLVTVIAGTVSLILIFFAESLLAIWTGDKVLAQKASKILVLYVIGNLFLVLSAFPYYLQYAKGNLHYHLYGNIGMAGLLIPSIVYFSQQYGGVGAGWVWLTVNAFFFFIWASFIHSKLSPTITLKWLLNDILLLIMPTASVIWILSKLVSLEAYRPITQLIYIFIVFVIALTMTAYRVSMLRINMCKIIRRCFK